MLKVTLNLAEVERIISNAQLLMKKELPAKTSFKLSRIFSKMQSEQEHLNKSRQKLVDKYGQKDEEGNPKIENQGNNSFFKIKPDKMEEFNKEFDDLMETEIEIEIECNGIAIDEFDDIKLTPAEMIVIEKFIISPKTPVTSVMG